MARLSRFLIIISVISVLSPVPGLKADPAPGTGYWMERLRDHRLPPSSRREAAAKLEGSADPGVLSALMAAASTDSDPSVRENAILSARKSITRATDPFGVALRLEGCIRNDSHASVRMAAAYAWILLYRARPEIDAVRGLESVLLDRRARGRREAAGALGDLGAVEVSSSLFSVFLSNEETEGLRVAVAQAIGKVTRLEPVYKFLPETVEVFRSDSSATVRKVASRILYDYSVKIPAEVTRRVLETIRDQNDRHILEAVSLLGLLETEESVPLLLRLLEESASDRLTSEVASSLRSFDKHPEVPQALLKKLEVSSHLSRAGILYSLHAALKRQWPKLDFDQRAYYIQALVERLGGAEPDSLLRHDHLRIIAHLLAYHVEHNSESDFSTRFRSHLEERYKVKVRRHPDLSIYVLDFLILSGLPLLTLADNSDQVRVPLPPMSSNERAELWKLIEPALK